MNPCDIQKNPLPVTHTFACFMGEEKRSFLYIACRAHFWRRKACFMGDNLQIFFYFAWKFRGVPSTAGSPGLAQSVHYVRSSGDPTEYQPLRSCRIFIAKQPVWRFILLDRREAPHRRLETVVAAVIIDLADLTKEHRPAAGLHRKIMIQ